jgi:hypothetical protein
MVRMRWSSRRSGVRVPFKRATLWIKVFTATGGTPSPGIRRVDPCMRLWMVRGFSGSVRLCPDVLRELLEGTHEAIARPTDDVPVVKPGCDVEA